MNTTVEKLVWTESLTLYNNSIDNQHKRLFDLVNEVIDTDQIYPRTEKFAQILSKLTDYGLEHFAHEEALMQKLNYPGLQEHKKDHLNYIYEVSMFNLNFREANCTDPKIVVKFMRDWWYKHILAMDMHFGKFIRHSISKEF
ncbi:MAG: bacteriohemerythrin [Bacteroidales bacterium]|nr:MAG: bacteriohemerythrin [Bacteroidales bacterium]